MIRDLLREDAIIPALQGTSREAVLWELSTRMAQAYPYAVLEEERVYDILLQRERLSSTGIGDGIAVPHGRLAKLPELCLALGISRDGVDFASVDAKPTHIFFVLLAPEGNVSGHLKVLARVCRLLKGTPLASELVGLETAESMYALLSKKEQFLSYAPSE